MSLVSSVKEILKHITGFTTPFFGLTWNTMKMRKNSEMRKNRKIKIYKKGVFKVIDGEPKYVSLLPNALDFLKLSSKVTLINAENIMWRVGYRFIKESSPRQEYVFHVYQDPDSDAFHSRIVVLEFGKERDPDIHKRHIGIQSTKKFKLVLKRKGDEVSLFCNDVFLGKQSIPFSAITDINIGVWTHKNINPILATIEDIFMWKKTDTELDSNKTEVKLPTINPTYGTHMKKSWYEYWWIKQLLFPLFILLLGGFLLYRFSWNSDYRDQNHNINILLKGEDTKTTQLPKGLEMPHIKLRSLYPLETGKKLGELPNATFFYAPAIDIEYEIKYPNNGYITARNHDSNDYFEIQKIDSRYYLVGYVSDEVQSKIPAIVKESIFAIIFPNTWGGATKAVAIPFDKIYTIKSRMLDLDESKSVTAFDVGFKEVFSNPFIHKNKNL